MPGAMKKAAVWLGLVSDDRFDEERAEAAEYTDSVYTDAMAEESVQVSSVTRLPERRPRSAPSGPHEPRRRDHHDVEDDAEESQPADLARIISVRPRTYNEARTIGESFREGTPVIMNLTDMDDADAKRLVDFAAGLIFGLHGSIERVTSKVFLLSPRNIHVTAEDKQRLASPSFFNQS
ncbi:cell division protein SepF [uncultured Propionibacterium sp.]|uniref:cell division protein SepF n=1 Tax=uncultured Propionibacterium sp. TaxID=218066 RepID=UPI0029311A7D|nr:cell division protein SepF [uncultured Propionibacterium sp.]